MHDGKDIKNKFLKSWKNDLSIAWFSYNISAYNLNLSESVQKSQTLIPRGAGLHAEALKLPMKNKKGPLSFSSSKTLSQNHLANQEGLWKEFLLF